MRYVFGHFGSCYLASGPTAKPGVGNSLHRVHEWLSITGGLENQLASF